MRKLIFTHSGNFSKRFGEPALAELRSRLKALSQFDERRGIETDVLYVDEARSSYELGVNARADNPTVEEIGEVIQAVNRKRGYDFFLIVGGDDTVPMFRYENPVGDDDKQIISDNGYAISRLAAHSNPYLVERAIGRLPNGSDEGPEVIWKQLDEIVAHEPIKKSQLSPVCFSAEFWESPSREVLRKLNHSTADIHLSPPVDIESEPPQFDKTWLYNHPLQFFNLHGSLVGAEWLGQQGKLSYPKAYQPSLVPNNLQHSVIVSEACYGADIVGTSRFPRSLARSLCLTCLNNRAAGFCGSSTIAYGATNSKPELSGADLLALYFLVAIQAGKPQGAALQYAKARLALEMATRYHVLDAITQKTLLQFQLYGDPSLVPVSDDTEGAKALGEFEQFVAQVKTGRLAVQINEQLGTPVIDSGAKKSMPSILMNPPKEFEEFQPQLISRHSQEVRWRPPGKSVTSVSSVGGAAAQMMYQTSEAVWHTEVYVLSSIEEGQRQFLVRVLRENLRQLAGSDHETFISVSR